MMRLKAAFFTMASQTRVAAVSTSRATRGSSVRGCGNAGKACSSGQRNQTTSSSSSYFNNTVQKVDQSDVWGTSKELYEEVRIRSESEEMFSIIHMP